jgi:DNA-directed RNA polymerase subunit RPC12/RpoP
MIYKCLNCGFKFRTPKVEYRRVPLNPGGVYAIDPRALYHPIAVCPKCGSDAIRVVGDVPPEPYTIK